MNGLDIYSSQSLSLVQAARFPNESSLLLTGTLAVCFANGLYARGLETVDTYGIIVALYSVFNINLVLLLAMWLSLDLVSKGTIVIDRPIDFIVVVGTLLAACIPVSAFSWIALSAMSIFLILFRRKDRSVSRVSFLILAVCFSAFWSRLIFRFFMDYILNFDAALVALLTQQPVSNNLIQAADGRTVLQVLEGCSSFANMSTAFLIWVCARCYYGTSGWARSAIYVVLLCVIIVGINTVRIGIIALWPASYDIVHGNIGANFTNVLMSLVTLAVAFRGAKR